LSIRHTVAVGCAALALPTAFAQSDVRLYGLMDLAFETSRSANGSQNRITSGGHQGSRWGMTGSEDLGGGLRAVFRLESGFSADDGLLGQGGRLFGREASVGLSHSGLGTFEFGRLPVPYYRVQNGVDAFVWSLGGGMLATTRTQAGASRQILPTAINARDDNALSYASPNIGGFVFRAQTALSENSATLGNSRGLSARYTSGAVDLVAGWNRQSSGSAGTGEVTAHVFGGSYNFGAARVFGGYTQEANSCSNCTGAFSRVTGVVGGNEAKFRIVNLGVRVPFGATTAIAQVAKIADRSQYAVNPGNRDATWLAVGVEHALSKRTMVYSSIGSIGNSNGSSYALGTGSSQQPASFATNPSRSTTFAIGMRHTF
jgi:predicted porin